MDESDAQIWPSVHRVFLRAHVLGSIAFRAALDSAGDDGSSRLKELHTWLHVVGVYSEMESSERAFVDAPIGTLTERALINASWRREGAAVLSWALSRYALPSYDQLADGPGACNALGFLDVNALESISPLLLRSKEELQSLDELYINVHWRFRHQRNTPGPYDMARWVTDLSFGHEAYGQLRFMSGDLAIQSLPFSSASEEQRRRVYSITLERHRAANWLVGDDPCYSAIALDT